MEYPDLQGRMLLFRYCFLTKPTHIFRTTRPDLIVDFNEGFEALQKTILCSILGCQPWELTNEIYCICCLRTIEGGLGFHHIYEVLHLLTLLLFLLG